MYFPRFQLGKLDKNESARSFALKFGRLKMFAGFGGGGGAIAPPALASYGPGLDRRNSVQTVL